VKNDKIAIVYCSLDDFPLELEQESIPDSEEEEIAVAVKAALESQGFDADILTIHPDRLETLAEYSWIFNLVESILGYDDLLYKIACGMEDLGLRFTGSSATTLWTCQDKAKTKEILVERGLLTPAYRVIKPEQAVETGLNFPLFVKPVSLESHIGISSNSVVYTPTELDAKVNEIHRLYKQAALVEEYIEGRDISVAVLGNGAALQVLPLSEVVFLSGFIGPKVQTYESTWIEGSIAYANNIAVCPCSLDDRTRDLMIEMARSSYNALGCWDYARIDFRLKGEKPYVLEVNPNPCLYPELAGFIVSSQVAGMDYSTTICKILESAMQRYAQPGIT
jgi:D-alanine-D-alanine ligase